MLPTARAVLLQFLLTDSLGNLSYQDSINNLKLNEWGTICCNQLKSIIKANKKVITVLEMFWRNALRQFLSTIQPMSLKKTSM